MNPRQRRGLLVTVIGVVAALLAFVAVANYTARVAQQVGPRTEVYRIARDIPAYSTITAGDLETDELPRKYLTPAVVTSSDELQGMVSATALTQGALLQSDSLVQAPTATPQERIISLQVDIEASVAGSVGPEDRVDIIAATKGSGTTEPVSKTVVSGVRVLRAEPISTSSSEGIGVGAAPAGGDGKAKPEGFSNFVVTLAVAPQQSEQVILADTIADSVRLALIPPTPGRARGPAAGESTAASAPNGQEATR